MAPATITTTYDATVTSVTRLTNSASGNPRWRLDLEGGAHVHTRADSAAGYDVTEALVGARVRIQAYARTGAVYSVDVIG